MFREYQRVGRNRFIAPLVRGTRNVVVGRRRNKAIAPYFPFNSHPYFSRALRATSGLGVFDGANCSRQCHGLHALISAT